MSNDSQKCYALLHSFDPTNIELALQLAESQGLSDVITHWQQLNELVDRLVNGCISYNDRAAVFLSLMDGIITVEYGEAPANMGICKDFLTALCLDEAGANAHLLYPELKQLHLLEELTLRGLPDNRLLGVLRHLPRLKWLGIDLCQTGKFIKLPNCIRQLKELQDLVLTTGPKIQNLEAIEALPNLKRLTLCGIYHPEADFKLNLPPLQVLTLDRVVLGETPKYRPRLYPPLRFLKADNLEYIVFHHCNFKLETHSEAAYWAYWEALAEFPALKGIQIYGHQTTYGIDTKKIKNWLAVHFPALSFYSA